MLKRLMPLLMICILSVCAAAQKSADLLGTIENGKYSNRYLNFEMSYPQGWIVIETEERKAMIKIGSEAIKTGNRRANSLMAESAKKEVVLLLVSENPLGSLENAVLGVSITKLPAKGYLPKMLAQTFKSTMLSNPKNQLVKDVSIQNIGDRSWGNVLLEMDVFGQLVRSNYFVHVVGDNALVVSMTYKNAKQLEKMEAALNGIKFTSK